MKVRQGVQFVDKITLDKSLVHFFEVCAPSLWAKAHGRSFV